jgi:hypothetical protein
MDNVQKHNTCVPTLFAPIEIRKSTTYKKLSMLYEIMNEPS